MFVEARLDSSRGVMKKNIVSWLSRVRQSRNSILNVIVDTHTHTQLSYFKLLNREKSIAQFKIGTICFCI